MDETQRMFEDFARPLRRAGESRKVQATKQGRPGELCLRPSEPHPGGYVHSAEATEARMRGPGRGVPGSAADQVMGGRGRS